MIESWIVLAVLGGIGSSIQNFLTRFVLKDGDDVMAFAWLFEVIRFMIFAVVICFQSPPTVTLYSVSVLLLGGIVEMASIYTWMKMHSLSHLSISAILIRLRLIWIPILAFFFLHEALYARDYVGILILLVGVIIAGLPHKLTYDKGMRYAYGFSFIGAILAIVMKTASDVATPAMIMFVMSAPSVFVIPFLMKNAKRRILSIFHTNGAAKVGISLISTGSFYLYAIALALGSVSIVQSVYQGMMVFSVLAGIILFREREDIPRKLLGTALTILGIVVITST